MGWYQIPYPWSKDNDITCICFNFGVLDGIIIHMPLYILSTKLSLRRTRPLKRSLIGPPFPHRDLRSIHLIYLGEGSTPGLWHEEVEKHNNSSHTTSKDQIRLGPEIRCICRGQLGNHQRGDDGRGLRTRYRIGHGVVAKLWSGHFGGHEVRQREKGGSPEEVEYEGQRCNGHGGVLGSVKCQTTGGHVDSEEDPHADEGRWSSPSSVDNEGGRDSPG